MADPMCGAAGSSGHIQSPGAQLGAAPGRCHKDINRLPCTSYGTASACGTNISTSISTSDLSIWSTHLSKMSNMKTPATDTPNLTAVLLNAANTMSEAINAGVAAAGFTDLRPAHGFVFARVAAGSVAVNAPTVALRVGVLASGSAAVGGATGVAAVNGAAGVAVVGVAVVGGAVVNGAAVVGGAAAGCTAGEIAAHLGVTKQAAAQVVEELVRKGYLSRHPHPKDFRAQLLSLTDRGWEATRAAARAADRISREWATTIGSDRLAQLARDLAAVAEPGPMRPIW